MWLSRYVVALCPDDGLLAIHSMLDQQIKQMITFPDARVLNDTSGQIFVASGNRISLLAPVSLDSQVDDLFNENRIAEALRLADVTLNAAHEADLDVKAFEQKRQSMFRIQRRAGFAEIQRGSFSEGFNLLAASNVDPRGVVALFPGLLRKDSRYLRTVPIDPGLTDITTVANTTSKLRDAQRALAEFLSVIRIDSVNPEWNSDVDTALAAVFALLGDSKKLMELLEGHHSCDGGALAELLPEHGMHHDHALLCISRGLNRQALEVWKKLENKAVTDPEYPGLDFAVDFLAKLEDIDLVYLNAEWMLTKDPTAVRIFTGSNSNVESDDIAGSGNDSLGNWTPRTKLFKSDEVLDFVRPFPGAVTMFLEHLILFDGDLTEKYHTQLALLYLDRIKRLLLEVQNREHTVGRQANGAVSGEDELVTLRSKFRRFLKASTAYKMESVLHGLRGTILYAECAIVYGKAGQHDMALDLLVHQLGDHAEAELYIYLLMGRK